MITHARRRAERAKLGSFLPRDPSHPGDLRTTCHSSVDPAEISRRFQMTTRNARRAYGRSPELQQLLTEAVGTLMLPVQRMVPERRLAREAEVNGRPSVPAQRTSSSGPQQLRVPSAEPWVYRPTTALPTAARRHRPGRRSRAVMLGQGLRSDAATPAAASSPTGAPQTA